MIRSVDFISQKQAEAFSDAPPQSDVALISISTPGAWPPKLPHIFEVLSLEFHDVDDHEEPWVVFDDEHANALLEFVSRIHGAEREWRCIVHCKAGISRSAAIALYVAAATGCEFSRREKADEANLLVLDVLSRASGLQVIRPEVA
jgi:predicted protein tyrosine phosphatase